MSNIDIQNAKQIRDKMEVYAGITGQTNTDLSFSITGNGIVDSNINDSFEADSWAMRKFADFQGDGFSLDGTRELVDTSIPGSLENGKIGFRTDIGGTATIVVSALSEIATLTIKVTSGTGTITANGVAYDIRNVLVIPVNALSVTLTVSSNDAERRVEIASIMAGIVVEFDNTNLISCQLDLRSNLSIVNPSFELSSIEIRAYWPDDISTAVSNISDDLPIWYYAGYNGDYSETRHFYLSEPITQLNNVLTIRGEDSAAKLEDAVNVEIARLDSTNANGKNKLYNWFVNTITNTGIKPVSIEDAPTTTSGTTGRSMILTQASPRDYVSDIMNLAHIGTFWPVFVDAGIPKITWTKPTSKWTINEIDCGDVSRTIQPNIAKIKVPETYENGILNTATRATKWTVIQSNISITRGKPITKNINDGYYWQYKVDYKLNDKFKKTLINKVSWTPSKTSVKQNGQWLYRPTLYGKALTVTPGDKAITPTPERPGQTTEITPLAIGKVYQGTQFVYPNYSQLFTRSNFGGSFTWKGDPRIQPRDVATFVHADGTSETITISSIELLHEGGGTTAKIGYMVGIV